MPQVSHAHKHAHKLCFSCENKLAEEGRCTIAGIDEVGRGPLAGPVTAAAVVINNPFPLTELNDSKRLSPKKRLALYQLIKEHADVGIGHGDVDEIDQINILQATFLAMSRAVQALPHPPDYTLVDGNRLPRQWPYAGHPEVGGDGRIMSIAAASVVAKVTRDKIMHTLAADFPQYGWQTNAGYGAKKHLDALTEYGITPHHRRSFAPVAKFCR